MAAPNHNNADLTIYDMVRNRLPFLKNTPANKTLVSTFTLEVMYEFEDCFKIRFDNTADPVVEDMARVGDEQYYSVMQKQVVADVVAVYILIIQALTNAAGTGSGGTAPLTTYLKMAKAGSAEVAYDQFNINSSVLLSLKASDLLDLYKKSAIRKAMKMGCIFDFCEGCSIEFLNLATPKPFIVIKDGGCGCGC